MTLIPESLRYKKYAVKLKTGKIIDLSLSEAYQLWYFLNKDFKDIKCDEDLEQGFINNPESNPDYLK